MNQKYQSREKGSTEKPRNKTITVASLNIRRGLYSKETLIKQTIDQNNFAIVGLHEVEIEYFDETRPFSIKGYKTYFPMLRKSGIVRSLCLVREDIEVKQRSDLMSSKIATVWLEIRGLDGKKILVCQYYREFNDRAGSGKMTPNEQLERFQEFCKQVEKAAAEACTICMGDLNLDLNKLEDDDFYLKNL